MRDAAKTAERILRATERILTTEGFTAIGVNRIASEAGVGKPLIYRYFGGLDGVRDALIERHLDPPMSLEMVEQSRDAINMFLRSGRELAQDPLRRALLVWDLATGLSNEPHEHAESDAGRVTYDSADRQAMAAVLGAAVRYLVLYRDRHEAWAGLGLQTPQDLVRLERAVANLVDAAWSSSGERAIR